MNSYQNLKNDKFMLGFKLFFSENSQKYEKIFKDSKLKSVYFETEHIYSVVYRTETVGLLFSHFFATFLNKCKSSKLYFLSLYYHISELMYNTWLIANIANCIHVPWSEGLSGFCLYTGAGICRPHLEKSR